MLIYCLCINIFIQCTILLVKSNNYQKIKKLTKVILYMVDTYCFFKLVLFFSSLKHFNVSLNFDNAKHINIYKSIIITCISVSFYRPTFIYVVTRKYVVSVIFIHKLFLKNTFVHNIIAANCYLCMNYTASTLQSCCELHSCTTCVHTIVT
jgi:hypothetical protein